MGGCQFRARCPFAMDACAQRPDDFPAGPGRLARCWLYVDSAKADSAGREGGTG